MGDHGDGRCKSAWVPPSGAGESMHRAGNNTHLVAHALGAAEHNGLVAARLAAQKVGQAIHLVVWRHNVDDLPDVLHST